MTSTTYDNADSRHHILLGGWRDILEELQRLNRDLQKLPDGCPCGQGGAHLAATCACCRDMAVAVHGDCSDCDELIHRLRAPMDVLAVDAFRFFPCVTEYLSREHQDAARRAAAIRTGVAELVESFRLLALAADRFRQHCRAEHLSELKHASAELCEKGKQLNRLV